MRLMYQEKMYDYKNREEANKHIEVMKAKGWFIKDQYEQKCSCHGDTWTVEYHR